MQKLLQALQLKSMRSRIVVALLLSTLSIVVAYSFIAIITLRQNLISAVDERLHQDYELASLSFFWQGNDQLSVRNAKHFHLEGEDEQEGRIARARLQAAQPQPSEP